MIMQIAFFEDAGARKFAPIALMRPVFELVCGHFSLRERLQSFRSAKGHADAWGAFVRTELAETYREAQPGFSVNDLNWLYGDSTLFLNGRWLADPQSLEGLAQDEVAVSGDTVVALHLDPLEAPLLTEDNWGESLGELARIRRRVELPGTLMKYPWDIVNQNPKQISRDFQLRGLRSEVREFGPHVAMMGPPENISVAPTAELEPFVLLDARRGPISIEAGAVVQSFTRIEGPCHIGREAQLFRANVKEGSTIGPGCRVGGEVETSILHGFANKYHEGFLGHSYVCPWTNLGALTTNSDLKNDYSPVQVPLTGDVFDTQQTKVGCFIGDHTKTAIGSLFNTGSSIGVMCMILPGGELLPKHVPSFSRIWHGELCDGWDLNRSLETARTAMGRRGREMSAAEERLIRHLERQTWAEREAALRRQQERQSPAVVPLAG
jgi:UDP-N-acetylglucosamine diphosphorylase / glucose-1-phosphate thymidylyltransferase / UDP-N-acetylgalactosamine diphosphorylase / glucosamine-1-phosphate N-acetyltransferase / galactosamine-1-phosphate N-acetyltransferase